MDGLVCSIFIERNEFGILEIVIRDPDGLEHRNALSCGLTGLSADDIYYALLHDSII